MDRLIEILESEINDCSDRYCDNRDEIDKAIDTLMKIKAVWKGRNT